MPGQLPNANLKQPDSSLAFTYCSDSESFAIRGGLGIPTPTGAGAVLGARGRGKVYHGVYVSLKWKPKHGPTSPSNIELHICI